MKKRIRCRRKAVSVVVKLCVEVQIQQITISRYQSRNISSHKYIRIHTRKSSNRRQIRINNIIMIIKRRSTCISTNTVQAQLYADL